VFERQKKKNIAPAQNRIPVTCHVVTCFSDSAVPVHEVRRRNKYIALEPFKYASESEKHVL